MRKYSTGHGRGGDWVEAIRKNGYEALHFVDHKIYQRSRGERKATGSPPMLVSFMRKRKAGGVVCTFTPRTRGAEEPSSTSSSSTPTTLVGFIPSSADKNPSVKCLRGQFAACRNPVKQAYVRWKKDAGITTAVVIDRGRKPKDKPCLNLSSKHSIRPAAPPTTKAQQQHIIVVISFPCTLSTRQRFLHVRNALAFTHSATKELSPSAARMPV